jgi:hypothetical protein
MDKDHGEMPESLMKSDSYIVLCRNSEGFHLFVNGRTDVLADLAGSLFNEHPELFQLMMERHQPNKAERVNMIMSFLKGVADGAIDGSTAADFLSSFAGGDGDIELTEAIEEFKCAMLDRDDLPPEAPEARHTMDEMNDFLAEIGRSVKKGGGEDDRN